MVARPDACRFRLTRYRVRGWRADAPSMADPAMRGDAAGAKRIVLQTTAPARVRAYARELGASRKLVLDVSLQGSERAMHEYHTQARSFKQTAAGDRNARRGGPPGRRDHVEVPRPSSVTFR